MIKRSLKPTQSIFGGRLRNARLHANLTQEALGVAIGLDEGLACVRISRYESGVHAPSLQVLQQLADALEIPAAYLVTEEEWLANAILKICRISESQRRQLDDLLAETT